ncbi:MAG TPA: DNA-processing protein DprA [Streptosporangiaceae bacterium]|nr:DNA-processing protein DprA [Streptosporangiaceae bacterium]
MEVTERQQRLLALCAIRIDGAGVDWSLVARQAQFDEGLDALWSGRIFETSSAARRSLPVLRRGIKKMQPLAERVAAEIEAADGAGAHLITVLDEHYPPNLRLIPNLPPFLFYRGTLAEADVWSVAVVGTRQASPAGLERAARLSGLLAGHQVTVISGLARGVDTAAHRAALDSGGRTIAVLGTGITRCYPPENRDLADRIAGSGALVSQFWPTRTPGKDTFPRRNVVTSGLSQGTAVIEASQTSGAKMQARLALEHGKKVFLLNSLVTDQEWARDYVTSRGAIAVDNVDEVLRHLAAADRVRQKARQHQQLSLTLL